MFPPFIWNNDDIGSHWWKTYDELEFTPDSCYNKTGVDRNVCMGRDNMQREKPLKYQKQIILRDFYDGGLRQK